MRKSVGIEKCYDRILDGRTSWFKYHIKHFNLFDVGFLTLSHPLIADIHGGFHSIDTDPMVALSFFATSLTYQYSVGHLNPVYR